MSNEDGTAITTSETEMVTVTETDHEHGEDCGCSHDHLDETESSAMQGFLSGLYASTLDREGFAGYLEAMSLETGSEFARPAEMLLEALEQFKEDGTNTPFATQYLAFVADEDEEE